LKHIPNILTFIRLLCIPIFAYTYVAVSTKIAFAIYVFASITDFFDGFLARRYNVVSTFGTVFDPLADKLLLLTALTCLFYSQLIPGWILIIMFAEELFMIASGIYFYFKPTKIVIPANRIGKLATLSFTISVALTFLIPNNRIIQYFITASVILKIISLSSYVWAFNNQIDN